MKGLRSPAGARRTTAVFTAAVAVILLMASCATVPPRSASQWLGVLPGDATLYASLSVRGSAELIRKMLKEAGPATQDIGTLMDRTERLVISVTLSSGAPARFAVVALGNYPSGIVGMRLAGNKNWTKKTTGSDTYWEWTRAGLQLSIPNNGILLASNGGVEALLGRWKSPVSLRVPPDVESDMEHSDLVLYMPELPGGLTEKAAANDVHIPLQEVWITAVRTAGGYTLGGTANTSSEKESKLLTLVLRLGIVAWMRTENIPNAAERLRSITVSPSGSQVKFGGLAITESEIVPLFLSLLKSITPPDDTVSAEVLP
jgi:hypothetical protein